MDKNVITNKEGKIGRIGILIALYIFCVCGAELMWAKTFPLINLFGYQLNASVGIFFIPLIYSINDVITEVFWPKFTRSLIRTSIFVIVLMVLAAVLFTWLPPSTRFATNNAAYLTIFGISIRISIASLIAFGVWDFLDVYLFSKIRKMFGPKRLWLRNNVSNILSEAIDTTLFMTIAFYAIGLPFADNVSFLLSIALPYRLLKCCASILVTPFVYMGVHRLKRDGK